MIANDSQIAVNQSAIATLGSMHNSIGLKSIESLAAKVVAGSLDSSLALDVRDAIEKIPDLSDSPLLKTQKYTYSRDGGDIDVGKELFATHMAAQCTRCPKVGRQGSEIGPELTTISKTRDPDHLLRSTIQPSANIDAKYRLQMYLTSSCEVFRGIPLKQDDNTTTIADSNGKTLTLDNDEIEETKDQTVAPMPDFTEFLSATDVRNLVAYLRSLQ